MSLPVPKSSVSDAGEIIENKVKPVDPSLNVYQKKVAENEILTADQNIQQLQKTQEEGIRVLGEIKAISEAVKSIFTNLNDLNAGLLMGLASAKVAFNFSLIFPNMKIFSAISRSVDILIL